MLFFTRVLDGLSVSKKVQGNAKIVGKSYTFSAVQDFNVNL